MNPGASLPFQKHFQRSEHWPLCTAPPDRKDLNLYHENNSPVVHRLANPGEIPPELIEGGQLSRRGHIVRLDGVPE